MNCCESDTHPNKSSTVSNDASDLPDILYQTQ